MSVLWIIASDEIVKVGAFERVLLESEMLVGAKIVNPKLSRPRFFSCGFAIEEEDVRLHTLRVEDAGRKTQQCVNIGLLE